MGTISLVHIAAYTRRPSGNEWEHSPPSLLVTCTSHTLSHVYAAANLPSAWAIQSIITGPWARSAAKGLLPRGEGKITAHTSWTAAPVVGWGQASGLTAGTNHQWNPRGQQWESALQFGATTALENIRSDPKMKKTSPKYTCTLLFNASLFTITKIWKEPTCPSIDEWMRKTAHARTCTRTRRLLVLEKNESMWDTMREPRGCYTTWSKSEKDTCMIWPLCGIGRQTHKYRE